MSISRAATGGFLTDDSGSGLTGTVLNNADRQAMLNLIDARWTEQLITLTGTQNDLVITASSLEADVLLLNNASDLTINGITAPTSPSRPGKPLALISMGAGNVLIGDQQLGSSAANRIITKTGVGLFLAAGIGTAMLRYDSANSRWHVMAFQQGTKLGYTSTWSAASGSAPSLGNGTKVSRFYLDGRQCRIEIILTGGSTTTFGSGGQLQFSLPFTADTSSAPSFVSEYNDTGAAIYPGRAYLNSGTVLGLYTGASPQAIVTNTAPFTFGNTDLIRVTGTYWLA